MTDSDISSDWCTRNNPQRLGKGILRLGNKWTSGNHPVYCIVKIGQNTEKTPQDLKRLAFTQNPVKKPHIFLV